MEMAERYIRLARREAAGLPINGPERSAQTAAIVALLREGRLTYQQVADRFGISRARVGQIAKRIGIQRKRGGRRHAPVPHE